MSISVGLGSGSRLANAATAKTKISQATAIQNSVPSRRGRLTGLTATSSSMLSSSVAMTNPGIEDGIQHIDNEVHQHVADRHEQHHALQNNQIAGKDGAEQQPADPRQRKNRLDDDG